MLRAVFAGALALSLNAAVGAEWKPDKAIEIVVPTSPGGGQDSMGRTLHAIIQSKKLTPVPISVVNKPGGGQAIGYNYVYQHSGDAHYIGISTVNLLTNQITGGNPLTYTDVTPIAMLVNEYVLFAVKADSSIRDARDFIERLRRDPASLSVGFSPGLGAASHISYGLVAQAAGADLRKLKTVVFKSGGEATTALLGGHIDCAIAAIPGVLPHLKAGKLRAVAVPAPRRLAGDLANVPTWKEVGVNAIFTNWRGVFGPPGLTPEQIAYWDRVLQQVVHTDEWQSTVERFHQEEAFMDAQGARTFLRMQHEVLKSVLTDLGLAK